MNQLFRSGLDRYFAAFSSTRELVKSLIEQEVHPQEILIMLCSRIDALSCAATAEEVAKGDAFVRFISTYGGDRKLFESVSAGDLYYELDYHLWLLPGILEKAGRLRLYSRLSDPILKLLVESEIPLTLPDAQRLVERLQRGLRRRFRVAPNQRRKKHAIGSADAITNALLDDFPPRRSTTNIEAVRKALNPLICSKTLARIIYEKYRCGVIHGGRVRIDDERFFTDKRPYWTPMYSEFYGPFELIHFPAQFLASLLSECLKNYRKRLEATGKVPPDIHFEMFIEDPFAHLDLLDETLLPRGRVAAPK
jgi:hypothetical protein